MGGASGSPALAMCFVILFYVRSRLVKLSQLSKLALWSSGL